MGDLSCRDEAFSRVGLLVKPNVGDGAADVSCTHYLARGRHLFFVGVPLEDARWTYHSDD